LKEPDKLLKKLRKIISNKDFGVDKEITASLGICEYAAGETAIR